MRQQPIGSTLEELAWPLCSGPAQTVKPASQAKADQELFQLCGQRSVAEIAAELARKLKLGLETRPPGEQIAAAKAWLAERRALRWCWTTSGKTTAT